MATDTVSTTSTAVKRPRKKAGGRRWWWVVGGVVLVALAAGAWLVWTRFAATPAAFVPPYTVGRGTVAASVAGSGSVAPDQALTLSFQGSGTLTAVKVQVGDVVTEGQVLAQLDDRVLLLQLANAKAGLANAQATLDDLHAGPSEAELTAAKLTLTNAKVQLANLTDGPSAADIAGARASWTTAQANLTEIRAGSDPVQIQTARNDLDRAKNSLWSQQLGRDAACVKPGIPCDQANATVGNGQIAVQQAQDALDRLIAGPSATDLRLAELAVQQASARLAELGAGPTADALTAGQLQVANAQARLDELLAGASALDTTKAEATVENAKLSLLQAQNAFDAATLRAPFAGVVTAVSLTPGASANVGTVTVVSRSGLHVDLKLNENDAVQVRAGLPVSLTFDALDGKSVAGTVRYVAPAAETSNGVVTYGVRVTLPADDESIRIGLSANVEIITAQKAGILLVPNSALLEVTDGYAVLLVRAANAASVTPTPDPSGATGPGGGRGFPRGGARGLNATQTPVQIGVSDGIYTEIISGLNEGDMIVEVAATATTAATTGGFRFPIPFVGGGGGGR